MSETATVLEFPLDRRAEQIADDGLDLDQAEARLAEVFRPFRLRALPDPAPTTPSAA